MEKTSKVEKVAVSIASSSANTLLPISCNRLSRNRCRCLNRFFISEYSLTVLHDAAEGSVNGPSQSLLHQRILSYEDLRRLLWLGRGEVSIASLSANTLLRAVAGKVVLDQEDVSIA